MFMSGLRCELDAIANKDVQCLTKKYLSQNLKEKNGLA